MLLFEELTLTNLLSYGSGGPRLELRPLNVLVGPNGSGKSNLIEAISLLRSAPAELVVPVREGGGVRDWLWKGAGAVASILDDFAEGRVDVASSAILELENSRNPDPVRREAVEGILIRLTHLGPSDDDLRSRAREVEQMGFRPVDALHLAAAERGRCDLLVSCDDRLLRQAEKRSSDLRVRVTDPLRAVSLLSGERQT